MLLSLPKYDFNWQRDYDPVEPILVKAGTKLIATWVYDNSEHNKANPDPKINVTWGEQSWEEMMYFRVNYRWADETTSNLRNDLQAKLMESRTIGALDNNADDLVQINELTGTMASMKAALRRPRPRQEWRPRQEGARGRQRLARRRPRPAATRTSTSRVVVPPQTTKAGAETLRPFSLIRLRSSGLANLFPESRAEDRASVEYGHLDPTIDRPAGRCVVGGGRAGLAPADRRDSVEVDAG